MVRRYATLHESLEQAAPDAVDVRERLILQAGAYVRFAHDHPDLYTTMFRGRPGVEPRGGESFDVLLRTVGDAQRSAIIPTTASAELMARSIWATLHGLALLGLRQPHERYGLGEPPEALAAETLSALFGL